MKELSILIPSRSEMFLKNTIEDILKNIEADTEVIAVLDGAWADPSIDQHGRVNIIYVPESIGQRGAQNLACRLSKAKYVMKVDAHCAFDKGFDRKMIEGFKQVGDDVTMVPVMNNLHAFNWKCKRCHWRQYQGPTPKQCGRCGRSKHIFREMIWQSRRGVHSTAYCFDSEPHFQYDSGRKIRPGYIEGKAGGFTETMSLQGSCFMCTREKYWEIELCDEKAGNWGNQGMEVAMATWLSGGRVFVNHNTWYAHMFRTQGGDFGFPYELSGRDVQRTKYNIRDKFWDNKWDKQKYPVSWLVERFWPVPGWTEDALAKLKRQENRKVIKNVV